MIHAIWKLFTALRNVGILLEEELSRETPAKTSYNQKGNY